MGWRVMSMTSVASLQITGLLGRHCIAVPVLTAELCHPPAPNSLTPFPRKTLPTAASFNLSKYIVCFIDSTFISLKMLSAGGHSVRRFLKFSFKTQFTLISCAYTEGEG